MTDEKPAGAREIARRGVRAKAIQGMSYSDKTLLYDLNNGRREGISVDGAKAAVLSGYFQIRRMTNPHNGASEWKTFLLHSGPPLREGSDVRLVSSFPSTGNLMDPLRRDTQKDFRCFLWAPLCEADWLK